ncbi:MAG: UvrD-helicase domain-containing protein [Micrococcales bacterium]|nr:UvrD-helicase domain-containing protein [Micrococcales bacterium]
MTPPEATPGTSRAPRHTALDIAAALGQHPPTPEQRAVIEAPLEPLLVVAGAGSGKTETMSARVVWLVANGLVQPDQVLGLTFTRKAATELAERIAARLRRLEAVGLWSPPDDDEAETLGGAPTVSTYHSYAGRLVREHALRLGYEPESRLLSEAAAWQFANEAALSYEGPMGESTAADTTITAAVIDMAGELAEHLREPEEVSALLAEIDEAIMRLPQGGSRAKGLPGTVSDMRKALRERAIILPIVSRFAELKRGRDAMDFADQVALAARLARTFPDIGEIERARFGVVLLDEFQDTSEAQFALLAALFAPDGAVAPVTAVGDPHQSIYGWRGASATTLTRFPGDFSGPDGTPAPTLPLSTSWRSSHAVLQTANAVAAPLRAGARVPVEPLRAAPTAQPGRVQAARLETIEDEATLVARWLTQARADGAQSSAVLCRKRSQFPAVIDALDAAGLPFEVVGLGGLLLTPEVEDITALLHAVADPTRGDQLMRLLTGPLCRLGAADLDGLMAWARHQQELRQRRLHRQADETSSDEAARDLDGEVAEDPEGPVPELAADAVDTASIVEAVDALPPRQWRGPDGERISELAHGRLEELGGILRRLRSLTALPLADLVGEAERALGLDIEVLARPGYTPAAARAHLDAFADVAATFSVSADRPTLAGFLAWLKAALKEERGLDKGYIEPSSDAVQVLTVHAAKGLEWDAVAVPGLVEGTFPADTATAAPRHDGTDWVLPEPKDKAWIGGLTKGGIPYELRGDRAGLPVLDWRGAEDLKDLQTRIGDFLLAGGQHALVEERRLAYVAFTRARQRMLLTAAVWGAPKSPRVTSRFLDEVRDQAEVIEWAASPGPLDDGKPPPNPPAAQGISGQWPVAVAADPRLGAAAEAVRETAGRLVGLPAAQRRADLGDQTGGILEELRLLLAERDALQARGDRVIDLPRHLSTSALVSLAQDSAAFTRELRRPMPQAPALAARRGTAFHAWVEQHYSRAAIVDVLELPGSADEGPADDTDLPAMKERFLASEWAHRMPLEIETSLETVIDGIAVRGRIDAVFPREGGGATIVDWKTGPPPQEGAGAARVVQLAAYRVAYARLRGLALTEVDAAFYYAGTGETRWPDLPDEAGLVALLRSVPTTG